MSAPLISGIAAPAGSGVSIELPTYQANDVLVLTAMWERADSFTAPLVRGWNLHSSWSFGKRLDCAWYRRVVGSEVVPNPQLPAPTEWSIAVICTDNIEPSDCGSNFSVIDSTQIDV